jgi:metal-sulfur cluster biosynthetic enzyme
MREPDACVLDRVAARLEDVLDPELQISVVALGLIRAVDVQDGHVHIRLTFTTMGCPWTDVIAADVRDRVIEVPGVRGVEVEEVWDERWTHRRLRADGRRRLREIGIAVP